MRFSLNILPSTAHQAAKSVAPIGCLYQPLRRSEDVPIAQYEPIICGNPGCRGILNPYSMLDLTAKIWSCRLCLHRNPLPPHYQAVSAESLPLELQPSGTTIEYVLSRTNPTPPLFLWVVDTCQDDEGLQALKDSLLVSLSLLPENAMVGLITYGTVVNVYELASASSEVVRSVVFNGSKEYPARKIQDQLGLRDSVNPRDRMALTKFLVPVQEAEFQLTNILEQLQKDSFPVRSDARSKRATGAALNVALSLIESGPHAPNAPTRIMLFGGGPCTEGPGLIVDPVLKDALRSHHDIDNENAKHYKKAEKYYQGLSGRACKTGAIVDIFAGCYDQIGLSEMRTLPMATGGVMVLTDSFSTSIFKQSLIRVFNRKDVDGTLDMGFNANFEVKMSRELKVAGLIGHGTALPANSKNDSQVAETEVGMGGTTTWKIPGISSSTTLTLFFDAASKNPPPQTDPSQQQQAIIQFITHYLHPSGTYRLRVTTLARALLTPANELAFSQSFDQEAALAIIARLAIHKAETGLPLQEVTRWIDGLLIRLCLRFAEFVRDDPQSFRLPPQFSLLPQFVYHLRRSQFLQVFNNSPDETAYYHHVFNHEDTTNCLIMVQPTLTAYELDKDEPEPVLLDSLSVTPDRVLLLDTFFHILIYHGETIAAWRKAGYQDLPEYENLKTLLQKPRTDAAEILTDRFPLPRFIDTEAKGSQSRFLFCRLNPSRSQSSFSGLSDGMILTDDVSLQDFMDYLIKLCVSSKNSKPYLSK